ncbi:MAG: hypothetical protein GW913_07645 [Myxococcales bacterium]|nr:hypothetical protein [Myxococcales bacterium]
MIPRLSRRSLLSLALVAWFLGGCPRTTQVPDRPAHAQVCNNLVDCQPDAGVLCGALLNCVDRRCEQEPSLFVPCE